jgi:hypothetical protein
MYGALKIVKNEIEWKKLQPSKVEGVKNSKKQATKHYKGQFPNTQNFPFMFLCCYHSSKMICRTLGGVPISL